MKILSTTLLPLFLFLTFSLIHNVTSAQTTFTCGSNPTVTIEYGTDYIKATATSGYKFKVQDMGDYSEVYAIWNTTYSDHPFDGQNNTDLNGMSAGTYRIFVNDQECSQQITLSGGGDTPPTPPANLSASNPTSSTVDLSWTASTDNVEVTSYEIYQDNFNVGSVTSTSYSVSGLSASTSYNFHVTAMDAAGNESGNSNAITVQTTASSGGGGSGNSQLWAGTNSTTSDISRNGRISIGTPNFDSDDCYKLLVKGGVKAEKIKVELCSSGGWCDYVFAEDYDLQPLAEVEKFINENQHLPNIPSEATLEEDGGIDVGHITVLQQEKIEEVFLHLIEMNKKIEVLTAELNELKKENQKLKNQK